MGTDAAAALAEQPASRTAAPYSARRLAAGILGRTWLWFVAGCLIVTLLPSLIGWRAFVVESGSMAPRLNVGDAVLASPDRDAQQLLGRVTVFTAPGARDRTVVHRVTAVNPDGTLTTRGDANPTPDSATVPIEDVVGLGRLLVRYVGLPLIWLQTGEWLWLALFLLSLLLAGVAISRDHEDDDDEQGDGPGAAVFPLPTRLGGSTAGLSAASTPADPGLRRLAATPRWVPRTAYVAVLASAVLIPSAGAAFAATTTNPGSTWSAGSWNYSGAVLALNPWLYWRLDESTGASTAADASGNGRTGSYLASGSATYFTHGVPGALVSSTPNRAVTLRNAASCVVMSSSSSVSTPAQLTEIVWFRTTATTTSRLLGLERPRTGVTSTGAAQDRHLYLDGAGRVWFGINSGGHQLLSSGTGFNDGQWHMAAATLGAGGMRLYVDGVLKGTNPSVTAVTSTGWWRTGCGNIAGLSATAVNYPFSGSLDEVSVWNVALTEAQLLSMFASR